MSFPTGLVDLTDLDSDGDSPLQARVDLRLAVEKLNLIIGSYNAANGVAAKGPDNKLLASDFPGGFVDLTGNQSVGGVKNFTSSPTIPNAISSSQPVAFGQYTAGKANPGWVKLPNAVLIQWAGAQTFTAAANQGQTFNFPVAFPLTGLSIVATALSPIVTIATAFLSTSQYSMSLSQSGTQFSMIAIGY